MNEWKNEQTFTLIDDYEKLDEKNGKKWKNWEIHIIKYRQKCSVAELDKKIIIISKDEKRKEILAFKEETEKKLRIKNEKVNKNRKLESVGSACN